jgi:hypothetical protein
MAMIELLQQYGMTITPKAAESDLLCGELKCNAYVGNIQLPERDLHYVVHYSETRNKQPNGNACTIKSNVYIRVEGDHKQSYPLFYDEAGKRQFSAREKKEYEAMYDTFLNDTEGQQHTGKRQRDAGFNKGEQHSESKRSRLVVPSHPPLITHTPHHSITLDIYTYDSNTTFTFVPTPDREVGDKVMFCFKKDDGQLYVSFVTIPPAWRQNDMINFQLPP